MVVVDSSALIPLAWIGRLDLVSTAFDDIRTTEGVCDEVLTEGKRGTAALDEFLGGIAVHDTPDRADEVASMEGIAGADASVILLTEDDEATDVLYDLVDEEMNLHTRVYAQVHKKLRELGD